ncbi:transporter substrate-binding domain-containing protein [Pseudomonas sp. CCM 7891]|uniref:Transporter substrate-binding domain-containing protein n=1 Tax=Pseudomonas karstica TaxID=1055468 RepID=A0A7X2RWE8_9PSED|nr:ABC transporter substrate-binding protein [Pseudomonas karstica]MTD22382.1 transporter substrate-binding domain-containing protein [Pseudomonas karstica]
MFSPWRLAAGLSILALGALWIVPVTAAQLVRVGAAHFPPYTVRPEQGADTGLLPQLLKALNLSQTDYLFVLVPTSIPRRFHDFQKGRVDMAIFENPQWGWQSIPHTAVDMGLEDAEVFVARREPGRDQSYFSDLAGKHLAVFSGYHYAFAHFNPDPQNMVEHFNATLTYSHDSNLLMVARGRADITLVTRSYLSDFMVRNTDMAGQFLVSEGTDQVYHHYALLRPKGPISGAAFAGLLRQLHANGELLKIFEPYRIDVLPVAAVPED